MTSATQHVDLNQHGELSENSELSQHGEFDPEQVAMLQDLARNGAPEAQMYAYSGAGDHDTGAHMTSYGDTSSNSMQSNELLQSQQDLDLDDPAALLESLANYEHPPQSEVQISNDHFASLLQAAATAGGQEAAQVNRSVTRRSTRRLRQADQLDAAQVHTPERRSKRQDNESTGISFTEGFVRSGNRRERTTEIVDDEEQLAREREIWGSEEPEDEDSFSENQYMGPSIPTSDARAAGVHSAAALFRRPSVASKKYTRPPMSKLFTSLDLTPEQFLHLQAAAKVYMLDPDHPERRDCVGNRGRGDTDMVKLKLFGCVKSFLEDEGWGDRCFGPEAEGIESRKVKWPQMKNRVISLVTPLLRRMVTNERQRQYAVQTRKLTPASVRPSSKKSKLHPTAPVTGLSQQSASTENDSPSRYPDIDPKLDQYRYSLNPPFSSTTTTGTGNGPDPGIAHGGHNNNCISESLVQVELNSVNVSPVYHINILTSGRRIRPKYVLQPNTCPDFSSLVQHIRTTLSDDSAQIENIQILTPEGLKEVEDEELWQDIIKMVLETEWMDGKIRVLANVDIDPNGERNDIRDEGIGNKDGDGEGNMEVEGRDLGG